MANRLMARWLTAALGLGLLAAVGGCGTAPLPTTAPTIAAPPVQSLILATTTSTADSGLLDFILPDFQQTHHSEVEVIAVGTGQALKLGARGDADVVLVHNREAEDEFIAAGFASERFDVMFNDFVIVGPTGDPAHVGGKTSAVEALRSIAAAEATFVSRGDNSGTHSKELSLWRSASITPTADLPWYQSIGQGMGDTLLFAHERHAYTLTDRATYLSMRHKLPDLMIVLGGQTLADNTDPTLLNAYGIMAVSPEKVPGVRYDLAITFINWIRSPQVQAMIGRYGADKFGQPLFHPGVPPGAASDADGG